MDTNRKPILDGSLTGVIISAEFLLSNGEAPQLARVLHQSVDKKGKVIGNHKKKSIAQYFSL